MSFLQPNEKTANLFAAVTDQTGRVSRASERDDLDTIQRSETALRIAKIGMNSADPGASMIRDITRCSTNYHMHQVHQFLWTCCEYLSVSTDSEMVIEGMEVMKSAVLALDLLGEVYQYLEPEQSQSHPNCPSMSTIRLSISGATKRRYMEYKRSLAKLLIEVHSKKTVRSHTDLVIEYPSSESETIEQLGTTLTSRLHYLQETHDPRIAGLAAVLIQPNLDKLRDLIICGVPTIFSDSTTRPSSM